MIQQLQVALFTREPVLMDNLDKKETFSSLTSNLGEFDGQALILPIPDDAPKEIPRITVNSGDGRYSINIALNRIDFFSNNIDQNEDYNFLVNHQTLAKKIFKYFEEVKSKTINRIGFIIFADEEVTIKEISDKYINNQQITNPKELNIRYNTLSSHKGFYFNNIVMIEAREGFPTKIQVDINTAAEKSDEYKFQENDFQEIMDHCIDQITNKMKEIPNGKE